MNMLNCSSNTCERSRASGAIRPTLKTVRLQLSALATRPLATARPYHARPTHQPSVSQAIQRPTSPNSASGGHEQPLPGTARALPRKVENRKKVQIPPSSRLLPYCCAAVVDWSRRTAPLLLCGSIAAAAAACLLPYCCAAVVDWSVRTAPLLLCGSAAAAAAAAGDYCVRFKNKTSAFCGYNLA